MRRHNHIAAAILAAILLAPGAAWSQSASAAALAAEEDALGSKTDAGGPSAELAGDVSRDASEAETGPGVEYDLFRFDVELRLKDKRRELMGTIEQMAALGGTANQADLLFRLAELNWEESRYWFFEANRQEDKALRCEEAKDDACAAAARAEQKTFLQHRDQYQERAIANYKDLIAGHPNYQRVDEVLFFLGHNLWEAGKDKEALDAYRTLIERFPESKFVPDAWLAFGEWYFNNSEGTRDMLQNALDAYTRAAAFPESQVYGFAVYKQGWTYYNLGEFAAAADKFKATVFYGELAQGVANANKTALIREARKDYVLAYSHYGDPTQARAAFQQVGGQDNWWTMLESLAGLYYSTGKDKEAVLVYRQLIKERPLSPQAPFYQARVVSAVMRIGHKPITVEQARLLVQLVREVEKSGAIRTDEDRESLERAMDLAERTLSNLAVSWHNEGKRSRHDETFEFASRIYVDYLQLFPESPKAYDLRFFHAELLYENLRRYDWAAAEYERVAAVDIARLEEKKRLEEAGEHEEAEKIEAGKWFVAALEGAIYSHDELTKKLPEEPERSEGKPGEPRPIPAPRQALLDACVRYLTWVEAGDKRVEIAYKAANILYRYDHFEEAVPLFADIALNHPENELAVYSAHLILDSYNLLEDWAKIDEWARRFHGEPRLARGKFKAELEEIIERNSFKMVALLEQESKFNEAAQRYLDFVAEWPGSDLADEALFNAAVDFHKGGQPERAIAVRDRLVAEYPKSELAPEALFQNAVALEQRADFAAAAAAYERYAAKWEATKAPARGRRRAPARNDEPKWEEEKARIALYNAGLFREALGEWRSALSARQRFLDHWPRADDAEAVYLSIADLHLAMGNGRLALRQLEAYQGERWARNAEKLLASHGRIAAIHESRGSIGLRNRTYEEIWKVWSRLPRARRDGMGGPALEAVAKAHFALSEPTWRTFDRIRIRLPQERMARDLRAKTEALVAVRDRYTETVGLRAAEPGICALERIGRAYADYAQALYDAPVPRGFNEEQVALYRAALAEEAMPVEATAQEAFTAAVMKSRELGIHTDCAADALGRLESAGMPGFAPLVEEPAEVRVAAASQGLGLLREEQPIPPPPPADVEIPSVVNEHIPGTQSAGSPSPDRRHDPELPEPGDDPDLLP